MDEAALAQALARLRTVCGHARGEQERFLEHLLRRAAHTEFGRRFGFETIRGGAEYSRKVPLSTFQDYDVSFTRMIRGERNILSADPPAFYNISAGSTGQPKYIPLCREDPEKQRLYVDEAIPGIIREALPQYSMDELFGCIFHLSEFYLTYMPDGTMNGVRSGVSIRTAHRDGSFDASCYTAPEEVLFPARLEDMLYLKVRFALGNEHVTAIHGIFAHRAAGMFDYVARHWDELISDIRHGTVSSCFQVSEDWKAYLREKLPPDPRRANQLAALDRETLREGMLPKIWTKLRYIRLINGPLFQPFSDKLAAFAGGVPVHSFIYAASESNIGVAPALGRAGEYVLLPDVCYFEFIPEEQIAAPSDFLTIRDVVQERRYEIVLTTLSGLYRYRIGDVVEVAGFLGESPVIRPCYRKDMVISLLDEKMNTVQLENAIRLFSEKTGIPVDNYCVAGNYDGFIPNYVLYLETDRKLPAGASGVMDRCLCESSLGYRGIRFMNELDAAKVFSVRRGTFNDYQRFCQEEGMRMEQSKLVRVLSGKKQIAFFESAGRREQ
jgi:hypothetical protein